MHKRVIQANLDDAHMSDDSLPVNLALLVLIRAGQTVTTGSCVSFLPVLSPRALAALAAALRHILDIVYRVACDACMMHMMHVSSFMIHDDLCGACMKQVAVGSSSTGLDLLQSVPTDAGDGTDFAGRDVCCFYMWSQSDPSEHVHCVVGQGPAYRCTMEVIDMMHAHFA